jgi:hypothetical protein
MLPLLEYIPARYDDSVQRKMGLRTLQAELPLNASTGAGPGSANAKYNSLQQYPHLAARLRGNVTPEEAFLVLRTLLRRDELDPFARISLFSELAAHLKSVVKFPQEALEGITDERYLRNVVDVIFRPRVFRRDHTSV